MLRFNEGVSIFLKLTFATKVDSLSKEDLIRFYMDFRVTYLVIRGTLGIGFTAWVRLVTSVVNGLLLRFNCSIWRGSRAVGRYFLSFVLISRLICSDLCLWFRGFNGLEGSSPASNETEARERFDCSLPRASFEGDWTICYRCRLLSVDLGMSPDWGS